MINQNLHKQAVALDRVKHRSLKLDVAAKDLSTVKGLNAFFVAGGEFGDACKDYPVVFVNAGQDEGGKALVAPIAVFGLRTGENLCIEGDDWRVRYVPAALRLYPFAMARIENEQLLVCIDESWKGFNSVEGQALFNEQGEPSEFTQQVQQQLEAFEADIDRTRQACSVLLEKGLLREMRFDATLPDGQQLAVDGFLTIDDDKMRALSDNDLLALARSGLLGLIHAHQLSLSNMTRLVEWHVARFGVQAAAAPAA